MENLCFKNIKMSGITAEAIDITMFYNETSKEPVSERTPVFRDIRFSNITCNGARGRAVNIRGLEEMPIENISLENVTISARQGISCTDAEGVVLRGVKITTKQGPALDAKNTDGLTLTNFIAGNTPKNSPVIKLTNARNATIHGSKCPENTDVYVQLSGKQTKNIRLIDNDFSGAKQDVKLDAGINANVILRE